MLVLFSYLLLSLSVKIDCSKGAGNGAGDDCSQGVTGTSEFKRLVKFTLYKRGYLLSAPYTLNLMENISDLFHAFSSRASTKILVHGWNDVKHSFNIVLKLAYLDNYNYNIIIANWNDAGGMMAKYEDASNEVPRVATQLGIFIKRLVSNYKLDPRDIHVIGDGLGAHIAGLSGKYLPPLGKIGRVTGLDPSKSEDRINTDSAMFVDIIHTCGGRFGKLHQIGHADFYPNGGRWPQPGCRINWKEKCCHKRALKYYEESIRHPSAFLSIPCWSWSDFKGKKCQNSPLDECMGESTSKMATGRYYLYTKDKKPFNNV